MYSSSNLTKEMHNPLPLVVFAISSGIVSNILNFSCIDCDGKDTCAEPVKRACLNNTEEAPEKFQNSYWGTTTTSNSTASEYSPTSTTSTA